MKVTATTLPRKSASATGLPSCEVNVKGGAGPITGSRPPPPASCAEPCREQQQRQYEKKRPATPAPFPELVIAGLDRATHAASPCVGAIAWMHGGMPGQKRQEMVSHWLRVCMLGPGPLVPSARVEVAVVDGNLSRRRDHVEHHFAGTEDCARLGIKSLNQSTTSPASSAGCNSLMAPGN